MDTAHHRAGSAQVIHLGARKRAVGLVLGLAATVLRGAGAMRRLFTSAPSPRRVLILEPFGMGDMISYQPLIQSLRRHGYDVRICAKPEWRSLYPEIAHWVPAQIPWSTYEEQKKYSLTQYASRSFRGFLRELRAAGRGSIGLDTRGDVRSVILLHRAGCREVLTLSNYLGSDLNNFAAAARKVPFGPRLRRWEINLSFLDALQLKRPDQIVPPKFPHLERPRVPLSARQLGVVPIAPWKGKWWDDEKWRAVITSVTAKGWKVRGLCGPGQSQAAAQALGEAVQIKQCDSVEDWAAELQKFSAIVTVDTGPMHLADALGVPVIALFGQGILPLWAPGGPQSRVLSRQLDPDFSLCHPIDKNTALGRKFMGRIQPAEVIEALLELQ